MGEVRAEEAAELVNRAASLHRAGDLAQAVKLYRRAIRRTPDASRAMDANFELSRVVVALGHALAGLGRIDEAERAMRSAVTRDPSNAIALANHAVMLRVQGRLAEAEAACRRALAVDDAYLPARHTLATVLAQAHRNAEAERVFLDVLAADPGHVHAMINLASLRAATDRFDEAIVLFNRALASVPDSAEIHLNLGMALSEIGRTEAAVAHLKEALAIDPENVEAWYALSMAGEAVLEKQDAERLVRLLEGGRLSDDHRVKLLFVLATSAERLGHSTRAFHDFRRANLVRKEALSFAGHTFDPVLHAATIDTIIAASPRDLLARPLAPLVTGPVFVVGLPRSGTTLVERIIAAHPDAYGAGERDDIHHLAERLAGGADADALAREYLDGLESVAHGRRIVVDKTPFNYLHLGVIARVLPGARIIHVRRDVRDVGVSCFTQNFVQPHAWTCDLEHIGDYITQYERLMAHWRMALPSGLMLEIDYEALVAEPQDVSRRIVAFCGLDWDPACLDFYAARGAVRSASKWQVRRPIYSSSVGRWKLYQQFLGPLVAHLR